MTKLEAAKKAVDTLFSDTSVSPEETLDTLEELREYIEEKIDALDVQIFDNGE